MSLIMGDFFDPDSVIVNGEDTTWVMDLNGNRTYDTDIGEPYSDLNANGNGIRPSPSPTTNTSSTTIKTAFSIMPAILSLISTTTAYMMTVRNFTDINNERRTTDPGDFAYTGQRQR